MFELNKPLRKEHPNSAGNRQLKNRGRKPSGEVRMRVKVEFEVEIKDGIKDSHVEEWLRFELGDTCEMKGSNPIGCVELEPVFGTFRWNRIR